MTDFSNKHVPHSPLKRLFDEKALVSNYTVHTRTRHFKQESCLIYRSIWHPSLINCNCIYTMHARQICQRLRREEQKVIFFNVLQFLRQNATPHKKSIICPSEDFAPYKRKQSPKLYVYAYYDYLCTSIPSMYIQ